jgi:hypothetical protein
MFSIKLIIINGLPIFSRELPIFLCLQFSPKLHDVKIYFLIKITLYFKLKQYFQN